MERYNYGSIFIRNMTKMHTKALNTAKSSQEAISTPRVVIVGGGFAGVACAQKLLRSDTSLHVTLISSKEFLTYYPALYHVVTGLNPEYAQIYYDDIFEKHLHSDSPFQFIHDTVTACDNQGREVITQSGDSYQYDYLVMATGSEAHYFNIEGVEERCFTFQSSHAAVHLKERIVNMARNHLVSSKEEMLKALHFVIVGAGASGVELAGDLASFARSLVSAHGIPESMVTIDLVERNERVLSRLPEKVSEKAEMRLRKLGVNLFLNRSMVKSESWKVFLSDMTLGAKTLIWTAGSRPHASTQNMNGFNYTKRGKIEVDEHFRAKNVEEVFVAGDLAAVGDSGLAQSAIRHGKHIAQVIEGSVSGKVLPDEYEVRELPVNIPIGVGWGIMAYKETVVTGWLAWILRFLIDARYFWSLVPFNDVVNRLMMVRRLYYRRHEICLPVEDVEHKNEE